MRATSVRPTARAVASEATIVGLEVPEALRGFGAPTIEGAER